MLKVLLVDASLFTSPYDGAISDALKVNGVEVGWATRRARAVETPELDAGDVSLPTFRLTDGSRYREGTAWRIAKAAEHVVDLRRIARAARRYDIVHFQWPTLPLMDAIAMRRLSRGRPVVLTVHDTTPFNGADVSRWQVRGFDRLFHAADHLIVHTQAARERLRDRGVAADRVSVVPHGPLPTRCVARPEPATPGRWRVVLFGRLQSYKGVDVLVDALGLLPPERRARLEVIVAGIPLTPMEPLIARARALGIDEATLRFRLGWMAEQAMANLLAGADCFVFPYRAIEASGALFLVGEHGKWIVASALGSFLDVIPDDGRQGRLVPPGDAEALAAALEDSIGRTPAPLGPGWAPGWAEIGAQTRALYEAMLAAHASGLQRDIRNTP